MSSLPWVLRLRGTAAFQVREDHWSLEQNLEGVRSRGAVLVDPSFVCPEQGLGQRWAFVGIRGCEGPQPSRSGRTIGALSKTWRASGPAAPCWSIRALFASASHGPMLGLPWGPRLRGTAALQVREDHWSLEQDLEGVRSRGAVLVDPSFVCRNKGWANVGPSLGSAAARDCSLQVRETHWSLDQDLE